MIENFFKENIKGIVPYVVKNEKFNIKLDANESPYKFTEATLDLVINKIKEIQFNRYPDGSGLELRKCYEKYCGVKYSNMIIGNGSDELIQIIYSAFIDKGDKVALLDTDFSMYSIYAKAAGGNPVYFKLENDFTLHTDDLIKFINIEKPKLFVLSNPNNPTGGALNSKEVIKIIEGCTCPTVIDEAYFEFFGDTVINQINNYENLIVLRTCSKAISAASMRVGFLISNDFVIKQMNKVKPPFNVNTISQEIGKIVLNCNQDIENNVEKTKKTREYVYNELNKFKDLRVYAANSNFILIETKYSQEIYLYLKSKEIIVRDFSEGRLNNCLRVSIGTKDEMQEFLTCFSQIYNSMNGKCENGR